MGSFLRSHDRVPKGLCPAAITLSPRIVCGNIVISRLAERRVQPTQLHADQAPGSVLDHRREEKNCRTEPGQLYPHGVNGFRIRCNSRFAIALNQMDAVLRDRLERGPAVEGRWRGAGDSLQAAFVVLSRSCHALDPEESRGRCPSVRVSLGAPTRVDPG